ncbi:MAG: HAD-IA family hydrolase [Gemmatimonadetes bacterium]|nr:HAD-IA family hydrolase [Gemmatimonadota bacterium]
MPTKNLDAILFDLDGTLVDSAELILESWRHTMRVHLGDVPPDNVWLATFGQPLRTQFKAFTDTPEGVQAMVDTYVEHNLREHERYIRRFPDVEETLMSLRDRGHALGIVTSKAKRGTGVSLAACGLDAAMFDVIVTSDEPIPHKPDPAPVRLALERLGISAGAAAYVGDSIWDMRSGRGAGVRTIAALWGPFSEEELAPEKPDVMLDSIRELIPRDA